LTKYFTVFGAWLFFFPINFIATTAAVTLQYLWALFNMPVDLWYQLDEELNQIHIEDE
jgi:hypothetical protein